MNLASGLRWILPSATLLPIVFLIDSSLNDDTHEWIVWTSILFCGALGFAFRSIKYQWKPFLVSGLGYLGTSVYFLYAGLQHTASMNYEARESAREWFNQAALIATAMIILVAMIALVVSWRIPMVSRDNRL